MGHDGVTPSGRCRETTRATAVERHDHSFPPRTVIETAKPRSLMIPPGVPEFATRDRAVGLDACKLRGRARSDFGPVMRVEVSADAGQSWTDASLVRPRQGGGGAGGNGNGARARPGFTSSAAAPPTARDEPSRCSTPGISGGYANNAVQRVRVVAKARTATTAASLTAPS